MKKIQLGALALIALATGMSAFSSSVKAAKANISNTKATFTYYVYATLTGLLQNNTRVVTVVSQTCGGTSKDCKIHTSTAATTTTGGKKLVADGTFSVLSQRN